jgi:ubiquinone/menaquinone biosynthesis C-methylase UbiE
MKKVADSDFQRQEAVNDYFRSRSLHWRDIYTSGGVHAEIIQDRHAAVLAWIDSLALAPGSSVLEVGCGAGFMAVALAERKFRVNAIDSSDAMIEQARCNAAQAGLTGQLCMDVGDVYSLAFEDGFFDLVIALGVIPWLERPDLAIRELARVARPGGHVILTTANWAGLVSYLDPWRNPALVPLKQGMKNVFTRVGLTQRSPSMSFHKNQFIDKTLSRAGLVKIRGMTRGFGLSFHHHAIIPEPQGTRLHYLLQRLADRNIPGFRSMGMAYFVLARKTIALDRQPGAYEGSS